MHSEKSKSHISSPNYTQLGKEKVLKLIILALLILLPMVGLASYQLGRQNTASNSKIESNGTKHTGQVRVEALLNNEVPVDTFDLQQIKTPTFTLTSQAAKLESLDSFDAYAFPELQKESFFCLSEGQINGKTVSFYVGESRYQNEKSELFFDRYKLLANFDLPDRALLEGRLTSCWRETDADIRITDPDFGIISWPEIQGQKIENKVLLFANNQQKVFTSKPFNKVIPLYLSDDYFLAVFQATGGGWDDTEVLTIDLNDLSFENQDNCASLFPRNSKAMIYDRNCSAGIEGNPQSSVGDYGFQRPETN